MLLKPEAFFASGFFFISSAVLFLSGYLQNYLTQTTDGGGGSGGAEKAARQRRRRSPPEAGHAKGARRFPLGDMFPCKALSECRSAERVKNL